MKHLMTFLPVVFAVVFNASRLAKGSVYTGSVLYPLNLPTGFSGAGLSGNPQAAAGGQVVGVGGGSGTGYQNHAILWSGTDGSAVDLNPTNLGGITASEAYATNGNQQVGFGYGSGTSDNALLWNGSASSVVDLNPINLGGITASKALGTNGNQQVGYGAGSGTGNNSHALLWSGTAGSAVDLNPTDLGGITGSAAFGTNGTQQVGYGYGSGTGNSDHALLWSGSAGSAVDLNPTNLNGITTSVAWGTNGAQQVGYGLGYISGTGDFSHALLWSGTAGSAVDLNPTDFSGIASSFAFGTNGTQQVGYGAGSGTGNNSHALLWSGSAGSAVDLQTLLPSSGSWTDSTAYTIDDAGDVFGTADGTYNGFTGTFAAEWSPVSVPEPASASLFVLASLGLLARQRRGITC
ncbi:MAG: hypothetical protein ABSB42_22365 [Tepidisphaeraceae bacterium]